MIEAGLRSGEGDAWLRVGGLKLFLDGTLGSRTAHMLSPFEDAQSLGTPNGVPVIDPETFAELVERAARSGLSTAVHAIGDAANRVALDGFEAVASRLPSQSSGLRQRIEHAQLLDPADICRFRAQNVVASMQPIHAMADHEVADAAWGERATNGYAWRSLIDSGAHVAFGSDAPIETLSVLAGINAAVRRQNLSNMPKEGVAHGAMCWRT